MSDEPPREGKAAAETAGELPPSEPRPKLGTLPGAASVPPPQGSQPPRASKPVSVPAPRSASPIPEVPRAPTLPLLPDFEAWITAAEAVKSPPRVEPIEKKSAPPPALTPEPPLAATPTPTPTPSSVGRRRSRRTVKIPDDRVPHATPEPSQVMHRLADLNFQSSPDPNELGAPPIVPPVDGEKTSEKPLAQDLSKTWIMDPPVMDASPPPSSPPSPAAAAPVRKSSPPRPASNRPPAAPVESDTQIRPVRIISIGSEPPPASASANGAIAITEDAAFARAPMGAWVDLGEMGHPPTGAEVEEVEQIDDAEVFSQRTHDSGPPTKRVPAPSESEDEENVARVSVESIDEIEAEAHVSAEVPIEVDVEEKKPAPPPPPAKKPPPPPPKREKLPSVPEIATAAPTPLPAPSGVKRQKAWWEELFGDDFLRTMERLDRKFTQRECNFIEDRLGVETGAVILDLACGPGLHAVELASRGYSVVGYDLSLAMLARAADEAQERGQKLNFLQGDMREMAFDETFDAVYSWNTSFGYFDDEKNYDVLRRIHRALRQGGMLLMDVINHDYVVCRQPSLVWFEGDGCVCMDEMSVDSFTSRLRVKRTVMFEDGRTREVDYAIRLYALHELGKMLHEVGFKVVEVTGHPAHPGVFFGSESPRIIILAERAEAKNRNPPAGVPGATIPDKPAHE